MAKEKPKAVRLYDNTRIQDFRRCPRYHYYRHERGWVQEAPVYALVFGSSWHKAQEVIWTASKEVRDTYELAKLAFLGFMENWEANGLPALESISAETMEQIAPHNPMVGMEMIYAYIEANGKLLRNPKLKVLAVEEPFAVQIEEANDVSVLYVGRIDAEIDMDGDVIGIEHKTTSAYKIDGGFRQSFLDSFSPNSQVDGYLHALHMKYGEKATAIWVDAALVHKKVHDAFRFIPIDRRVEQLEAWLWETQYWIMQIEANRTAAKLTKPDDQFMAAFPKNTNSCFDFNRNCPYQPLCKMWSNPMGKEMPAGFRSEPWSPFDVLRLARLGLVEEK